MASAPPEVETHQDTVVLRPVGDIDFESAESLSEAALAHVENDSVGLVIDLSLAGYVDSAGVRVLFSIANRLEARRQRLAVVVAADAPLRRVLAIVDLQSRASLHGSLDGALEHLRG